MEKYKTNIYKKALSVLLSLTMLFSFMGQGVQYTYATTVDDFPYKYAITDNTSADTNIDSATNSWVLHVVYERWGSIYYKKNLGAEELVWVGSNPSIAIGPDDAPQIAYVNWWNIIFWYKTDTWTWAIIYAWSSPDIDVDSSNYAHIAFKSTYYWDRYVDVTYATNITGDFVVSGIANWLYTDFWGSSWYADYYESIPVIKIDSDSKYHILTQHHVINKAPGWIDHSYEIKYITNASWKANSGRSWNISPNKNSLSLSDDWTPRISFSTAWNIYYATVDAVWTWSESSLISWTIPSIFTSWGRIWISFIDWSNNVQYIEDPGTGTFGSSKYVDTWTSSTLALYWANNYIYYIKNDWVDDEVRLAASTSVYTVPWVIESTDGSFVSFTWSIELSWLDAGWIYMLMSWSTMVSSWALIAWWSTGSLELISSYYLDFDYYPLTLSWSNNWSQITNLDTKSFYIGPVNYVDLYNNIWTTLNWLGIANNFNWVTNENVRNFSPLYFEDIQYWKILFNDPLDLTNSWTISFLQNLPNYLNIDNWYIDFEVANSDFANYGAQLYMYFTWSNVPDFNWVALNYITARSSSWLIMEDALGRSTLTCAAWIDIPYQVCTFNNDHFTSFDFNPYIINVTAWNVIANNSWSYDFSWNASENLNWVTLTFSWATTWYITMYLSWSEISDNSFAGVFDLSSFWEWDIDYTITPVDTNMNVWISYDWTISKDTVVPTITEVTPVNSPTTDNTPNLTLSSSEIANPSYSGSCNSSFWQFWGGINNIILNTLADWTYNACYITLTDLAWNESIPLLLSTFTIDTTPPVVWSISYNPVYLWFTSWKPTISATITDATSAITGCEYTGNWINWYAGAWTPDSLNSKTWVCSQYFWAGLADGSTYWMNIRWTDSIWLTWTWAWAMKTNDAYAPISLVDTGSTIVNTQSFSVTFTGSDARSWVKEFTLYYRFNSEGWMLYWTWTSSPFTFDISTNTWSEDGNGTYDFYTIASDNVGNTEVKASPTAERSTLVDTVSPTWYVSDPTTHWEVKWNIPVYVSTEDYGSYIKDVCLKYWTGSPTNLIACKNLSDKDWNSYNYAPSFWFTWDTTLVDDWNFNLYLEMIDNASNTGITNPIPVIINNYSTGSSSSNPAYISTCQEFQNISNHPGWYYELSNNIDCSETSTWNSNHWFQPIANFDWTVDGKWYEVSNLYQNISDNGWIFASNWWTIVGLNLKWVNMRATWYMWWLTNNNYWLINKSSITWIIVCWYQQCWGLAGSNNWTISESWADLAISGGWYIGIIAGHSTAWNIVNCYAKGKITASSDSSSIVWLNQSSSHVSNVYSVAEVIWTNEIWWLIWWQYSWWSQSDSYWNVDTSGKTNMCWTTRLGWWECDDSHGLTDAQMKTQESFSGWNFSTIWAIDPVKNGGYPYLINNHDTTPPEYLKAETISRNSLLVYFDEDIDYWALDISDFEVKIDSTIYPITNMSESEGIVTLTLSWTLSTDTPTVRINPSVPRSIKDVWWNEQLETITKTSIDKVGPTVIKLWDWTTDYTLNAPTEVYLDFNEEISTEGKNAIENALNAAANKEYGSAWSLWSKSLAIANPSGIPLVFANDVIANVTDLAWNISTWLILIDSSLSSDTSISSSSYTINNTNATISNVPYRTSKTTFLAALSKNESHQTWVDTGIATTVVSWNTLFVRAEDWEATKTFTITVNAGSSWGGGGWWSTSVDFCPSWDYSSSYYDGSCWVIPAWSWSTNTGSKNTWSTGSWSWAEGDSYTGSGIHFSDIEWSFAYDDILILVSKWVIKGYPDGTFRPNGNASRWEFLAMVMKAFDITINPNDITNFTDIPDESAWMIPYIAKAKTYWINWQIKNGKAIFRPNDPISRIEALAMLFKIKWLSTDSDKTLEFNDEFESWMIPYVIKAKELWIMNWQIIDDELMMRPNDYITRAETVRIIMKTLWL